MRDRNVRLVTLVVIAVILIIGLNGYLVVDFHSSKLSGDQSLEGKTVKGDYIQLTDYMTMTLTFDIQEGWKLFGVGEAVLPEEVPLRAFDLEDET